jgi:aryl-alcohol dehydrogenase-like predicted oxidoreductase
MMGGGRMSATPQATRQYFERLKKKNLEVPSAKLGATDLTVSKIGFGGYRLNEFDPDHREALREALLSGCNLIDTSGNYTGGSSERLIGDVTSELFRSGDLAREEIIFVTKAGYLQGQTLKLARERAGTVRAYPDMVEFAADAWHNISPQFLEDQITESLARLKISTIDVFLLHNPEYYLKTSGSSREVYYSRIEKAFRHLETEQARGRIRCYGVSSNTFPEPESKSEFTSLARLVEIAKHISSDRRSPHHFAVVQMPFNLFEAGAALIENNRGQCALNYAAQEKLGILTNRPFNAFEKGRHVRLTSFPLHDDVEIKGRLHSVLGRAIELEKRAPGFPKSHQGFQWAHALRDRVADIDDVLSWKDALAQQIYPSIRLALSKLGPSDEAWAQDFQNAMQDLLSLITADLENLQHQKNQVLIEQITNLAPALSSSPTLSRMVLRVYRALPQITTILVGMRTPNYVHDALETDEAPLDSVLALELLARMQRHRQ